MSTRTLLCRVFVLGAPKGQPRARAVRRGLHARVYDPGTADGWKLAIQQAVFSLAERPTQASGPVALELRCYFPRPKSHHRKASYLEPLKPTAPRYHTAKPDADNIAKAAADALTGVGLWHDDAQVTELVVSKLYTEGPGFKTAMVAGCELSIYALDNTLAPSPLD